MPDQQTTINAIVHSSEDPPRSSGRRNYGATRSEPPENPPRVVIRNGQEIAAGSRSPPKPLLGDTNRPTTSSVQHPISDLGDEQSRATFYIGSVATDEGGLLDAECQRPASPAVHRRPSDEESEEDYYDVRNGDQVV